jgi:hypothetical protein
MKFSSVLSERCLREIRPAVSPPAEVGWSYRAIPSHVKGVVYAYFCFSGAYNMNDDGCRVLWEQE